MEMFLGNYAFRSYAFCAAILGINRGTLRKKMRRFGLSASN